MRMRGRTPRTALAAVVVPALVLAVGPVPPARATTSLTITLTGTFTLNSPFGYPCTGPAPGPGGTMSIGAQDPQLCPDDTPLTQPPLTLLTHLPTTHLITQQTTLDYHHNRTTIAAFGLSTCTDEVTNRNKAGKQPAHTGSCSASLHTTPKPDGNTAAGACGRATGQVQIVFTDSSGQVYDMDLHLVVSGGTVAVEGHFRKRVGGQNGLVAGVIQAIPPTPATSAGQSCANKTARVFTLSGNVTGAG